MIYQILFLSLLAGALHAVAPDRWMPTSLLVWKMKWNFGKTMGFAALALGFHVLLGVAVCFALGEIFFRMQPQDLFAFSIILVLLTALVRVWRFSRIREVMGARANSPWGVFAVISILGPAETVIPVLLKARESGLGFLLPALTFYAGVLGTGLLLVFLGRRVWDRPFRLRFWTAWAQSKRVIFPVAGVVVVNLLLLLQVN
ncbi:hypothetical protein WDW86_00555 [Bdellovibrionota bacterium FG-2]